MCVCEDVLKLDAPLLGVYYNTDSSRNPKPNKPLFYYPGLNDRHSYALRLLQWDRCL